MTPVQGNMEKILQLVIVAVFLEAVVTEELPRFVIEPQSMVVKNHANVVLKCEVQPPSAVIRWKYNEEPITTDEDTGISIRNGNLHIASFKHTKNKESHVGTYQCVAETSAGAILSRPANLRRASLGRFRDDGMSDLLMVVNATEGNVAVIPCTPPKGEPDPVVIFEYNGTTIDRNTDRYKLMPSGNLQISEVRPSDQGYYRCVAKNTVSGQKKNANNQVQLRVTAPLNDASPVITLPPVKNTEAIVGSNLTLECAASGSPVPVITWTKYGGFPLPEGRYKQINGNLILENIHLQDKGTYICSAQRGVGQGQAVTAISMVDVLELPTITKAPNDLVIRPGDTATFQCKTAGSGKVRTRWLHNADAVFEDQHIEIEDTSLTIINVKPEHAGIYQCVAGSKIGTTYAYARLQVQTQDNTTSETSESPRQGVPSGTAGVTHTSAGEMYPPSKPELLQVSLTSVFLKWSIPLNSDGLKIRFFKVQYKDGRWKTVEETLPPTTTQYEVKKLRPGKKYRFRIAAVFENNETRFSPRTERFTMRNYQLEDYPPGEVNPPTRGSQAKKPVITHAPYNMTAPAGSTATMHCIAQNAEYVKWLKEGSDLSVGSKYELEPGQLKIYDVDTSDRGQYFCVAVNGDGFVMAGAFLDVGQAVSDRNPSLRRNTICTTMPTTTVSGRRRNITEKERGGRRRKKPGRKGKKGRGKKGREEVTMIPPGKPEVTKLSDTSVMLAWTVPKNDGLRITFFRVQYKQLKKGEKKSRWQTIDIDIPENARKHEVSGLKPGHRYKFRIAAVYSNNDNKVGPTSKSFLLDVVRRPIMEQPQVGPVIVSARPLSPTSIAIEWQYLYTDQSPIEGFFIYYKPYDAGDDKYVRVSILDREKRDYVIERLKASTEYLIRMTCFNSAGSSGYSNSVAKQTLPSDSMSGAFPQDFPLGIDLFADVSQTSSQPSSNPTKQYHPAGSTDESEHQYIPDNSTQKSNEMLYMVLGIVLGVMTLLLVIFMVMCAWKQRQQRRMMAAIDASVRNKFQDPSQRIHNDSMRAKHMNGFLLNGISNGKPGNGHIPNGHGPAVYNSNSKMNISVNPMRDEESENEDEHRRSDSAERTPSMDGTLPSSRQGTLPMRSFGYQGNADPNYNNTERNRNLQYYTAEYIPNSTENLQNYPHYPPAPEHPPDYNSLRAQMYGHGSHDQVHRSHDHLQRSHDHINGSRGHITRSRDHISANEHQPQVSKQKRRRKRPNREHSLNSNNMSTTMKDQATNTDLSSNEGTLDDHSFNAYPPLEGSIHEDRPNSRSHTPPQYHPDYQRHISDSAYNYDNE